LFGDAAQQIFKQPAPSLQAKQSDQPEPPHEITICAHAILRDLGDIRRGRQSAVEKNPTALPTRPGKDCFRRARMGSAKGLARKPIAPAFNMGELMAAEAFDG
jgi:hypothetical protein